MLHPCVSFLLIEDDRILLEKRALTKESDPGLVAIPGGHIEKGESQEEALYREIEEELKVEALSSTYLCSLYHPTTELQLIHYYVISSWHGDIEAIEADEVFWQPIRKCDLDIAADNIALKEYLRLSEVLNSVKAQ